MSKKPSSLTSLTTMLHYAFASSVSLSSRRERALSEKLSSLTSLKALRTERAFTQAEVARAIGTSATQIHRWEQGACIPSPFYLRKLAHYYHIRIEDFVALLSRQKQQANHESR